MRSQPNAFIVFAIAVAVPWCAVRAAQQPTFSTVSELVVLHVGVKDRRGAPVPDLSQQAFSVVEDGVPQTIRFFASQDAPVTVGLLIDNSGSMQPSLDLVVASALAFAEASNPEDEFFAVAFNDNVRALLPEGIPFTSSPGVLRDSLATRMTARGQTALFQALAAGLDYVTRGRNERKALVLVSDGGDNASRVTFDDVYTRTQASNTLIYTVALFDPEDRDRNPKLLKRIAEASGGESFQPRTRRDIAAVLDQVAHDLRTIYTIGYVSTNTSHDGAFRRVRVNARTASGARLAVHTRAGYLAPAR